MDRTITLDGVEYKLVPVGESNQAKQSNRRTGYERAKLHDVYHYITSTGIVDTLRDGGNGKDTNARYDSGNYYTDMSLSEDIAREENLKKRMRRFSAEHRKRPLVWGDSGKPNYFIYYDFFKNDLEITHVYATKRSFEVYFDSEETAKAVIEEFYDELIWLHTRFHDTAEFRD